MNIENVKYWALISYVWILQDTRKQNIEHAVEHNQEWTSTLET